jgi:hypothetical protein
VFLRSVLQLLVTANFSSSLIPFNLMMEVTRSSDTSVLTRVTRHHIPEDGILHNDFVYAYNQKWQCGGCKNPVVKF